LFNRLVDFVFLNGPDSCDTMTRRVTVNDFARLFHTTPEDVEKKCGDLIEAYDFEYNFLSRPEFEQTLLKVIQTIDHGQMPVSGKARLKDWERGWSENLNDFVKSDHEPSALVPRYMYKFGLKRLFSRYIRPVDEHFELNFYTVYRQYLFKAYLEGYDPLCEFGCGSGYNLVILARLFPEKALIGLDWAESSVNLVNRVASSLDLRLRGRQFDFFHPDHHFEAGKGAAFITLNAMEQLGKDYQAFLQFLLDKRPALCIHAEPLVELYDQENLLDYLAVKYHRKRGYLDNYLTELRGLEKKGAIEIKAVKRIHFGSTFHEGYSLVIWAPRSMEA